MVKRRGASLGLLMLLAVWLGLNALFLGLNARTALERAREEVSSSGLALHRVVSQRVAQHDALLTSLVALALVADPPPQDAILQVSQRFMRFYPRVAGIDLVALKETVGTVALHPVISIASPPADHRSLAAALYALTPGEPRSFLDPPMPTHYLVGKKASAANPALAVIIEIDAALLVEPSERPPWAHATLALDGQTLVQWPAEQEAAALSFLPTPRFTRAIDSTSQPLTLTLVRPLSLAEILDPKLSLGFAILSLLALLVLHYAWRQRLAARQSAETARLAEQRTRLLEHETRLAHAARVNALGELASGIAHELTQPLTALLSQSQAARRLARPGSDPALLEQALEANVREARRAGEMLKRMRDYISNRETSPVFTPVARIVDDVAGLVKADLDRRGIALVLENAAPDACILADPIEMEQVLHNLIRNAADSLDSTGLEKSITVRISALPASAATVEGHVEIRVSDSGPGIPETALPRLFEPFFTTKPDGLGLGLSLCATLLERCGGNISAANAPAGGAVFTLTLPEAGAARQAAQ